MPGRTNLSHHSLENDTLLDRLPYCFLHTTWFCQHKERKIFISKWPCNVLFVYFFCQRCYLLCSHSNSDLFACEDTVMYLVFG